MNEKNNIHDEGVILLSLAVFERAIKDYKNAHKTLKRMQVPDWIVGLQKGHSKYLDGLKPKKQKEYLKLMRDSRVIEANRTISEVENLFHSSFWCAVTGIDGDAILERLKKEIQNEV